MRNIANTPEPPYYSVIFTSILSPDHKDYEDMANEMVQLASLQSGFLGVESAREDVGITVSYWDSLESIQLWKQNTRHLEAQNCGKARWYKHYHVRIAKVERDYLFQSSD